MTDIGKVIICWGGFVRLPFTVANWVPNPLLMMSADEQYRQNKANGFFTNDEIIKETHPTRIKRICLDGKEFDVTDNDARVLDDSPPLTEFQIEVSVDEVVNKCDAIVPVTNAVEHEVFQIWAANTGLFTDRSRFGDGYAKPMVQMAWEGWIARAKSTIEVLPE